MSFTYDLAVIATSEKDQVRLLIGDTDSTDVLLRDEEINYFLTAEGSVYAAAVVACRTIAANFARQSDFWIGTIRTNNAERSKAFSAKADELNRKRLISGSSPFAGGISIADKDTRRDDGDRVQPAFSRNTHVPPGESIGAIEEGDLTAR